MFRLPFPRRSFPDPTTDGRRIYAIGDIHGRFDLFEKLLAEIEADNASREPAETVVVLLGDLVDRGPDSASAVARAMEPLGWARLLCLKGNHEAVMASALAGDQAMMELWLRHGGIEALSSWGLQLDECDWPSAYEEILDAARHAIPDRQLAWISQLPLSYRSGDFYFVHAGVRPGVAIDKQATNDQLWIREPFLSSRADHGAVIVHGHSITDEIQARPNRIGIDTGAYMSGRLAALALEGTERWFF